MVEKIKDLIKNRGEAELRRLIPVQKKFKILHYILIFIQILKLHLKSKKLERMLLMEKCLLMN